MKLKTTIKFHLLFFLFIIGSGFIASSGCETLDEDPPIPCSQMIEFTSTESQSAETLSQIYDVNAGAEALEVHKGEILVQREENELLTQRPYRLYVPPSYDDGTFINNQPHPGARSTTSRWAELSECDTIPTKTGRMNLVPFWRPETLAEHYQDCRDGVTVELWTMENVGHVPRLISRLRWGNAIYDWLLQTVDG